MPVQSDSLKVLRRIPEIRFEEELRGYSKGQVDRVLGKLAPLANEIESLQSRLAEAETRAASAEARVVEQSERASAAEESASISAETAASSTVPDSSSEAKLASGQGSVDATAAMSEPAVLPETSADFDETLRKTLVTAQRTADETVRQATEEAEQLRADAHNEADQLRGQAQEEADELSTETERRREELLEEADLERQGLLEAAAAEAERRRLAAEAGLAQAEGAERADLLEQISNLQHIRSMLTSDIEHLEEHLAQRRASVQTAIQEMQVVLDQPTGIRSESPPALAVVDEVNPDDFAAVEVQLDAEFVAAEAANLAIVEQATASDQPAPGGEDEIGGASVFEATAATPVVSVDAEDAPSEESVALDPPVDGLADPLDAAFMAPPLVDVDAGDASVPEFGNVSAAQSSQDSLFDEVVVAEGSDGDETSEEPAVIDVSSFDSSSFDSSSPDSSSFDSSSFDSSSPDSDAKAASDVFASSIAKDVDTEPPVVQDPFLEQLRQATNESASDATGDNALDRFLESDEPDRKPGGWFGRRK